MICIGYGRFPPQNTIEVWVTIVSMLIGASFYAVFIGHISTLVYSVDSASRQYNERVNNNIIIVNDFGYVNLILVF